MLVSKQFCALNVGNRKTVNTAKIAAIATIAITVVLSSPVASFIFNFLLYFSNIIIIRFMIFINSTVNSFTLETECHQDRDDHQNHDSDTRTYEHRHRLGFHLF